MLLLLVEPARACGGSPELGLCMAAQKGPFVMKYYVVLSPTAPEHPSVLPQRRGQKQTERWKREKKRRRKERHLKQRRKTKNKRKRPKMRNTVICNDSGKGYGYLRKGLKPNTLLLSLLTR